MYALTNAGSELLDGVKPGLDQRHVSQRVGDPVAEQAAAHGCLCVVEQPQQGALFLAVIAIAQQLQLPVWQFD